MPSLNASIAAANAGTHEANCGLITTARGCLVEVRVREAGVKDRRTFRPAVQPVREAFGIRHMVLVGDRGRIATAALDALRAMDGTDWITALERASITAHVEDGQLEVALFVGRYLLEFSAPEYPIEQLVACRNLALATLHARKREAFLAYTDAALDGLYIIRTSASTDALCAAQYVRHYKALSNVERVFHTVEGVDLTARPIHHRTADRVRTPLFLCMPADYVEWHMCGGWRALTFAHTDHHAKATRDPVAPAKRFETALALRGHRQPERDATTGTGADSAHRRVDTNGNSFRMPS